MMPACLAAGAMDTTRSTLHFAEHARRVALAPTVNVTVTAADQLRRLRAANAALQAQLVPAHPGSRCPVPPD